MTRNIHNQDVIVGEYFNTSVRGAGYNGTFGQYFLDTNVALVEFFGCYWFLKVIFLNEEKSYASKTSKPATC